jgi:hypothetical protein
VQGNGLHDYLVPVQDQCCYMPFPNPFTDMHKIWRLHKAGSRFSFYGRLRTGRLSAVKSRTGLPGYPIAIESLLFFKLEKCVLKKWKTADIMRKISRYSIEGNPFLRYK